MYGKTILFLVIDGTLAWDNFSHFRKNLLERILSSLVTIDDRTEDEKPQYDIIREEAKILALPSVKIDKYGHLTGGEILPSDQSRKEAKFTYSSLGKVFEKR